MEMLMLNGRNYTGGVQKVYGEASSAPIKTKEEPKEDNNER